ncbi:unnamed protein product [Mytilus edulis]|uniref:DUF6589 domain-containing protein n=1 Tax=Mytilus edulis TaxID=6550 RepID=A0A8S3TNU2_MYTED|nr:unnamed protein product [Mytilus edulis]
MTPVPSPSIDSVVKSECFAKPKQVKRSLLNDSGFTDNSTEHSYSKPLKNDVKHHAKESSDTLKSMNNHKHGFISQLMKKSYSDMSAFSWDNICEEFKDKLPVLSKMIELTLNIHQKKVAPRIGMVYAILAQTHHQKLSLVQRMTSLCLLDNIADQKQNNIKFKLMINKKFITINLHSTKMTATLPRRVQNIRLDYTKHIVKAAIKHVPFFKILDDVFDESSKINEEQYRKTLVIPLETVLKNEQYYADVVDIMEQHENIIEKTFQDAGVTLTDKTKIHTGGDQLTRERYSGAKVLRAAEANVFFDLLYKDKSAGDIGTLKLVDGQFMNLKVRLANGKEVQISPRLPEKNKETPPETDKVMNYGQMVLELGLLFKELLDVCKSLTRRNCYDC